MKLIKTTLIISTLIFLPQAWRLIKPQVAQLQVRPLARQWAKTVKSTVGGAVVGAGTGAMFKSGDKGKAARKGGAVGAAVGAVRQQLPVKREAKAQLSEQVPVR